MVALPRSDHQDLTNRIRYIKANTDCRRLAESELGPGSHRGEYVRYRSPFRDDGKKASFVVYADYFKDFGGGKERLDCLDFIQKLHRMSLQQALEYLESWLGTTPTPASHRVIVHHDFKRTVSEPPSAEWQHAAQAEVDRHHRYLMGDSHDAQQARQWLLGRGITDELIIQYHLGYNPKRSKTEYRIKDQDGTVRYAWLAPGITIPWFIGDVLWVVRVRSRVGTLGMALGIRPDHKSEKGSDGKYHLVLDENGQPEEADKYLCLTGSKPSGAIFNADAIQAGKPVLFVEGEFDAMLGQQRLGEQAAVVTLGGAASGLPSRYRESVQQASVILIALDTDNAGQTGKDRLLQQLGDQARVLRYPNGKDLTEFVIEHNGDLPQWFTAALIAVSCATGVSDGIRSAALNCKLEAGLITYELVIQAGRKPGQRFTVNDLIEDSKRLGLNIASSLIRRGLKAQEFFARSGRESTRRESNETPLYPDSANNSPRRGRKTQFFALRTEDEIRVNLRARLPFALLKKHFTLRAKAPLLPPLDDPEMLSACGLSEDDLDLLLALASKASKRQNPIDAQRQFNKYREALKEMLAQLDSRYSTPLPPGGVNGPQYRAVFLRTISETDPAARSYHDIGLLTGVRDQNVSSIIKRAGIKNRNRPLEFVPIASAKGILHQAYKAAKGRGKLCYIVARQDGREVAREPFNRETIQAWGETQLAVGLELGVLLHVASRQEIVAEVRPLKPRSSKRRMVDPTTDFSVQMPLTPEPMKKEQVKQHKPSDAGNADRLYLRDCALLSIWRIGGFGAPRWSAVQDITLADVVRFVQRYTVDDQRLIDRQTGEIVDNLMSRQLADCIRGEGSVESMGVTDKEVGATGELSDEGVQMIQIVAANGGKMKESELRRQSGLAPDVFGRVFDYLLREEYLERDAKDSLIKLGSTGRAA